MKPPAVLRSQARDIDQGVGYQRRAKENRQDERRDEQPAEGRGWRYVAVSVKEGGRWGTIG